MRKTPFGTVKINAHLFIDETETSNFEWLEYIYWTERVFGKNSPEFLAALPDTSVWMTEDCFLIMPLRYLRGPAYSNKPVIGVTQEQAERFLQWKSDRVFEYQLIRLGIIDRDPAQRSATYFSIERYFKGQYLGKTPDPKAVYYPAYRLPAYNEWKQAVHYNDSIVQRNRKCKNDTWLIHCSVESCSTTEPFVPVFNHCFSSKKSISNLRGNAREWSSKKNMSLGGGWRDDRSIVMAQDTFYTLSPNAWTGFRGVCEWKKWELK